MAEKLPSAGQAPKQDAVKTTLKATAAGLSPMALVMALPEPYATWVLYACAVFACAGFAATQIPIPHDTNSRFILFYKFLRFLAVNWKYAANTAIALRGKSEITSKKDIKE